MARFGGDLNMRGTAGTKKPLKGPMPSRLKKKPVKRPELVGKAGRPRAVVDMALVDRLARIQCTVSEIAAIIGGHPSTLLQNAEFAPRYNKGSESGKMSLRRKQHQVAIKNGNTAMLIFLGKQYLGQKDRSELTGAGDGPLQLQHQMALIGKLSIEEQDKLAELLEKAQIPVEGRKNV